MRFQWFSNGVARASRKYAARPNSVIVKAYIESSVQIKMSQNC
jgi:hypothetical protein